MGSAKTHPHIERPSEEQLRVAVENRNPVIRELYLAMHQLVLETVPDVNYSVDCHDGEIGYGARQYGYNGWGMAAVVPYTNWVSLAFLAGAQLDDPAGILEGTSSTIRHVKVRSWEQFTDLRVSLQGLVGAAARLNRGTSA